MSSSRLFVAALCLAVSLGSVLPSRAETVLAQRGRAPRYSIVHAADATAPFLLAAKELQDFVQQMTGVSLPILSDAEAMPARAILVGPGRHSLAVAGAAAALAELGPEAFLLRRSGPHLLILGDERGTLYGVYELLERAGCRWYASWHSHIPQLEQWTPPADFDLRQKPAFRMREPHWYDMFDTFQALRNKCNGNRMRLEAEHGGRLRFGGGLFCHTFNQLMPPGEFFASHPEYYSLIDGKRQRDRSQLCLSNPEVLRIVTERVLERIRKDPSAAMFSVSQNDWRNPCACDACLALRERYGNEAGVLLYFVNSVAEAVEKEFPDVLIETLAYQYTREPPQNIRPRRNVMHRLCSIECDFARPLDQSDDPQNQKFVQDIQGWSALTEQLFIWDYVTNFSHYVGPHPNFGALQGNIQFFRDNHVIGIMEQGNYQSHHAEFAELRGWLLAKLLWNPDADIAALLDDFFNGYYGPAAPLVRQYFDALQALVKPPENKVKIYDSLTRPWYSDEFFRWASDIWQAAEEAVKDQPAFLDNVRKGAIPVYYARVERTDLPKISYRWTEDQILPENLPGDYQQLVSGLLERMAGPRPIRISENGERHATLMTKWQRYVVGNPVKSIRHGAFQVSVAAALDGRMGVFKDASGLNYLDSEQGSSFFHNGLRMTTAAPQLFRVQSAEPSRLSLSFTQRNQYRIDRVFALSDEGLSLENKINNLSHERELPLVPTTGFALALGDDEQLCWRLDEGPWQSFLRPNDLFFSMRSIHGEELAAARSFSVASPRSGRGMRFGMDRQHARIVIQTRGDGNGASVFFVEAPQAVAAIGSHSSNYRLLPLAELSGLPAASASSLPLPREQQRIVLEDCFINIVRAGYWGDHGADALADDGSAVILYNNNYEWCATLRPDLSLFPAPQGYRVRARIRVEKEKQEGKAFWAGIYDYESRKSVSYYVVNNQDIADNSYQWYDIGPANQAWLPEKGHTIWFGPGQFDMKTEKSAIKAVYIDRIEFLPARP
jgi:hypothetical protein